MSRRMVGAAVVVLTAAGLVGPPAAEALAAPPAQAGTPVQRSKPEPTRMAVVEVIEDDGQGKTRRRRFWLSMTGTRTSRIEVHEGGLDCDLDLRKERDDGNQADLYLSLDHRRVGADRRIRRAKLAVSQRLAIGKATNMATVSRPGGGRLRVIATLR